MTLAISPRSSGKLLAARHGIVIPTVTAGGGGDGLEVNGEIVDRQEAHSCSIVLVSKATLAQGQTLTVQLTVQDGDASDGSDMADNVEHVAAAATVQTLTGDTGGSTEVGVYKLDVDLSGYKRYMRVQVEPTLSAGSIDTATVAGAVVLGGLVTAPKA